MNGAQLLITHGSSSGLMNGPPAQLCVEAKVNKSKCRSFDSAEERFARMTARMGHGGLAGDSHIGRVGLWFPTLATKFHEAGSSTRCACRERQQGWNAVIEHELQAKSCYIQPKGFPPGSGEVK